MGGTINVILFARPLIKLYHRTHDDDFRLLAIKSCILCIISIVTTMIALIVVGQTNEYMLAISTDQMITCLCITLMYKWNSPIAEILLHCCLYPNRQKNIESGNIEKNLDDQVKATQKKSSQKPDLVNNRSISTKKDCLDTKMSKVNVQKMVKVTSNTI